MNNNNGRDHRGRFQRGCTPGPGRPRRATEDEYLQTLSETVTVEKWRRIVERGVSDALAGDARAREWLSKFLVGDALVVSVHVATDSANVRVLEHDDWYDNLDNLKDKGTVNG